MVEKFVKKLDAKGLLDNTYIFYTTDNGYHIGQHRMQPGKECPFESDIHIPLAVRGPGVPAGHTADVVSSHTDLTPTILKLAGVDRSDLDGSAIPLTSSELGDPDSGEHVNVEFWGDAIGESRYEILGWDNPNVVASGKKTGNKNTYKAPRIIGDGYNLLYTVWCTGEREYYDLTTPPKCKTTYTNLTDTYTVANRPFKRIVHRLNGLLMVTKSCEAKSCREPWETLHPDGSVTCLKDALDVKYNTFYRNQPKVGFSSCVLGHIISGEGPQDVNVYGSHEARSLDFGVELRSVHDREHWSWWT